MPAVAEAIPEEDEDDSSSNYLVKDSPDATEEHDEHDDRNQSEPGLEGEHTDKVPEMTRPVRVTRSIRRTESESSSSSDIDVSPLGIDDISFNIKCGYQSSSEDDFHYSPTEPGRFFNVAEVNRNKKKNESRGQRNWRRALRLIKDRGDPWERFGLDSLRSEKGIRHRYNPISQEWIKDECVLRIGKIPFAHGAMRECFRMKKLSNFSHSNDWLRDSNNFVGKRYMDRATDRDTYFQDVKLQMDAKLWGEEYNRHNPPKKVDIFMMAVVELPERPGHPLFHIEHFIDGEYVKYNSNSGFVDTSNSGFCRQTPQAFSHFTFERSGHELVVVDVQGVGDLYTDPQIHTASGIEYGDGNLGTRGMALFFHSHKCNRICGSLGLQQFDLSTNEHQVISTGILDSVSSETRVRLEDVLLCESPSSQDKTDFRKFFRQRSGSCGFVDYDRAELGRTYSLASDCSPNYSRNNSECEGSNTSHFHLETDEDQEYDETMESEEQDCKQDPQEKHVNFHHFPRVRRPQRGDTETSTDSGVVIPAKRRQRGITECMDEWSGEKRDELRVRIDLKSRPSCISAEIIQLKDKGEESILGQIHLDLAKYHETCRFDADILDTESALFHLRAAADCGNLQAMVAISQLYSGLPNDILPALSTEDAAQYEKGKMEDIGLDYMTSAARMGDIDSILYIARAFDTGLNLGTDRKASGAEALGWYSLAAQAGADQVYLLQARMAELLLQGVEGVERDPSRAGELYSSAAASATENMKGKLATKYYMLAEEAWGQCEE